MKQSIQAPTTLRLAGNSPNDSQDKRRRKLSKTSLINFLNRINFSDGEISLQFRHNKYQSVISLQANPQVCNNDLLRCYWSKPLKADSKLKHFTFENFSFSDGLKQIHVAAIVRELNNSEVSLELPEACFELKSRNGKRYDCYDVKAQISQDGKIVDGILKNISPIAFGIESEPSTVNPRYEMDPEAVTHLVLRKKNEYIFSGTCKFVRHAHSINKNTVVLTPLKNKIQQFKTKKVRSERFTLSPLPTIIFKHPLTEKNINLGILDISGTGFSVEEDLETSVLIPGLIIPELKLEFMHGFSVMCKAQVIYRTQQKDMFKCGLAFLDMSVNDHIKLSSCLHQAKNKHSYVSSTSIDPDDLWEFFFEAGFIYPEKYSHISEQKDKFKNLYIKLYNESPEIARHVIYQDKGKIYGHVSMFRYYQTTWLMHHHAALKSSKHKAGLVVMDHILQYINEFNTIPSAKMNYIACYFRPNNRFADRVFGGAARSLQDQQKASLDTFAYFHYKPDNPPLDFETPWSLTETDADDLYILGYWYKQQSGGLMIDGFDLTPDAEIFDRATNFEYKEAGFKRTRKLYSLKNNDELIAVFILNKSDLGMNMSDLTNCIQLLILDPGQLHKDDLFNCLSRLAGCYAEKEVPILLYPETYAINEDLIYEKTYTLTVLDLDHISPYLKFMQSLTTKRENKVKPLEAVSSNS
jgi:hypothetical protein